MRYGINMYCDESCHLEHDSQRAMVLGAVSCPEGEVRSVSKRLRELKERHGLSRDFEAKWVKVSPAKIDYYIGLVGTFFAIDHLRFRGVVVPDKSVLNHDGFLQDHDTWYYKMWFVLIKAALTPGFSYNIYLDIKDSRSQAKVNALLGILRGKFGASSQSLINRIQHVRSHEVEVMQLADVIIGALAYLHRGLKTSEAKLAVIEAIKERSGVSLVDTTSTISEKINLLVWNHRESR